MPWFKVWDGLKNKTCRYLLHRYLGQFLEEKLNLEQLNVELFNGKATVKNVSLNVSALNELFEAQGWSVEVTRGTIGLITVTVPWNALMTNNSFIEISDLFICLRPVQRQNNGTSMLESMWSSVSSSLQLAQECMNQSDDDCNIEQVGQKDSIDGLEKFAETIDNVLNRIRAKCKNVTFKLEYLPKDCLRGVAVLININNLNYQTNVDDNQKKKLNISDCKDEAYINEIEDLFYNNVNILSTFATHNISLYDVCIYTEEFKVSNSNSDSRIHNLWEFTGSKYFSQTRTENSEEKSDRKKSIEGKNESIPTPILSIKGQQRILLKIKQSEDIDGPKVIFDIELGEICFIVTPRQIHLLSQFYELFCDNDTAVPFKNVETMPSLVTSVESSRIKNFTSSMTGGLENQNIWGEIHDNEYIKPTESFGKRLHSKSEYQFCESISSSISSTSTVTSSTRFQRKVPNIDICGDISKFNVKIKTLMALILQADILVEQNISMYSSPLNEKSQLDMLDIAEKFFYTFNNKSNERNLENNTTMCNKNHISLRISPIMVDGMQQRNKNVLLLNMSITTTTVDLQEILEDISSTLISFTRDENSAKGYNTRPEITINMKSTAPFNIKCPVKRAILPRTDFEISLEKCVIECDISIYDRLSAIIGLSPFKKYHQIQVQEIRNTCKDESYTNVKLVSGAIEIKLRFPIVDARSINDPDRVPWWKQNIRTDYLLLCLNEIRLTVGLNNFEIKANEIDAFYCESSMTKTHLLKVTGSCDSTPLMDPVFENPKIVIETTNPVDFRDCGNCNTECYSNDCYCLPFSAKRVCRQSDAIHSKHDIPEESETFVLPGETAEIRKFCDTTFKSSKLKIKIDLPNVKLQFESKQLYEIVYNRLNSDLFMWESCSPIFQGSLENQTELLIAQNISTGLLDTLYESSTATFYSFERSEDNEHMENNDLKQLPAFGVTSSTENLEHNTFATEKKKSSHENKKCGKFINKSITSINPSICSVEVRIGKGLLTFIVPTRDIENKILPMELGKFIIKLNNLNIFFVSGHKSNKNLEYLCLNLNNLEVFHCGLIPAGFPTSLNMSPDLPTYMKSTFYETPSCLTKGKGDGCIGREMVSVVIEINKKPEQRIKRLKITTGLQKTTLRHNSALPSKTWLCQLLDFLEIKDYPVSGYEPYGIISEMQLHLWDCSIDYRPKNFPFRSVIEIGVFNISSNIISSVIGCTLRFVAEECVLSIAPFDINIVYPDCKITTIPSSDLVPVLDIGLLDISLRLSDKSTERCPKLDFRTAIQDVHLRTCSDSGSALAQLISYIANDENTFKSKDNTSSTSSTHSSIQTEDEDERCGGRKYLSADISDEQQEHVNKLMAEAVQEPSASFEKSYTISNKNASDEGIEVFYFPDEGNQSSSNDLSDLPADQDAKISPSCYSQAPDELNDLLSFEDNVMSNSYFINTDITIETLPQIKEDLGDISAINKHCMESITNKYDDYCFIAEEETSFMTNFGIKNVNVSDDPLRIVDNHFLVPICKPDLLKSPENFPMAENRYTLCEMTFTWHLYGGNDFPMIDGAANQPTNKAPFISSKGCKPNMSEAYKHGVSDTGSILFVKKPKEKLTWKTIGGVNRHHEVLVEIQLSKVRFSHEAYSDYTTHASRQVLVVNELEIRDRLQSSDINKFLYHPKSNNLPNKSNQNMIVLKALHVRPSPKINISQECSLRISLLPLRLHIDQDTLLFLVEFFTNLSDNCKNEALQTKVDSRNTSSLPFCEIQDPVMKVNAIPDAVQDLYARRLVSENLDILMKDQKQSESNSVEMNAKDENSLIYFREVVFSPEVLIRFDYHGRRVELSRGPMTGLLMGLGQLQCSEIRLRKIVYKRGLLGFEKLISYLCKEWLRDIKKNQLSKILSGVGPTYAFIQLFQGIYDLFWLPIEQFQKDGRIIKGLQLGAHSFTARTALAALEITSRIIQLLQFTAETAFDMVSPGPTIRRQRIERKGRRKRQHRPKDIREGVTNAYIIMKEGFNDSAHKFIETAVAEHDQKGYTGAVGAVIRQIPQLVVCPAVLATQATTNILGGAKSSLVPEAKLEARDKWKDDTD